MKRVTIVMGDVSAKHFVEILKKKRAHFDDSEWALIQDKIIMIENQVDQTYENDGWVRGGPWRG